MTIGILLHPYGEKEPGGLPRMILNWTKAMIEMGTEHEFIVFLKEHPKNMPSFSGKNWSCHVLGGGRFWLDQLKSAPQADVYLFNTAVLPMFHRVPKSVVVSLDYPYKSIKPRNFHEWKMRLLLSWYHKRSLRRADHVVAISGAAKHDTMKYFKLHEEKITLIPHGYTDICSIEQEEVPLPEKFFFFAGTLKERKNVHRIIDAFAEVKKEVPRLREKLVIAGKKTGVYYEHLLKQVADARLEDDVIFLGHINDNQLSYTYRRATATVFPSLIEATGNPIIESMYCGVPVITSNSNGPAELGANGSAVLVDPRNTEEIAAAMKRIVVDDMFAQHLVAKGKEQVKQFTWESAAASLLRTLEVVAK